MDGEDVAETVAKKAGGGGGNLLMAPINIISGLGRGVFGGTVGNPLGVLMAGGIFAAIAKIAPHFLTWLPFKVGGKQVGQKVGEDMLEGGNGALIKDSLIAGVAIQAAIGGTKGAVGGLSGGGEEQGFLGKTAGFIGGAVTIVGIAAVVMNSAKKNGVGFAGEADAAGAKSPSPTPNPQKPADLSVKKS